MSQVRSSSSAARPAHWFRGDINGLRVLAIGPVVAFHAGFPGFSGGFIGVDVFFVISGFLITTNLVREVTATSRVNVAQFWAKRVRRLLPASVLMILVTLPLALWILSPLQWSTLGRDAGSALLYISNFVFAQQATDYFAVDLGDPSPYLHMWSLGVEEQFYVLWPLLIIAAAAFARRRGVSIQRILLVAFSVTIVLSFALSLYWTQTAPAAAFYLLPTRAWEFAAAGLVAMLSTKFLGAPALRATMIVVGGVVLLGTVFLLTEAAPFPGFAALLPVVATILIILGGRTREGETQVWPARLLAIAPMQWVGKLSYSWYLWHWPFIVLAGVAFETQTSWVLGTAALASLGAAVLTYYLVENPIRFSPALTQSLRRTFIAAATVTALGLAAAVGSYVQGGIAAEKFGTIEQARSERPNHDCDRSSTVVDGVTLCEMGALESTTTIALIGDSHAGQWKEALGEAAEQENIRLVVRWFRSCPAIGIDTVNSNGVWTVECPPFVSDTAMVLETLQPDAVVIAQAEAYDGRIINAQGEELSSAEEIALWKDSFSRTLSALSSVTPSTGFIQDNPRLDYDPNTCLVRAGSTAESCASPRDEALDGTAVLQAASMSVISDSQVSFVFTTNDTLCSDICKVMDDGVPVYQDYNHLSRQWTMTQVPELRAFLASLVR
ncbi:acyltransferase [Salinibacterium sp. NG22]|uniref:acyltransferase family protein n=1 Tax=Salinibacterium sp. NG22 TaxID=2792040 RepID=UPI0018CE3C51|nr:acyltransferase family protein [Salinibacterium sp. NG22]MBH0110862.1 acyltransferase [Salinibacterium sp. NG22]